MIFEDETEVLRTWFNSTDNESRLLAEWHSMSLKEAMKEKPEESEVPVFRSFVDKLMSLKYQLHEDYHTDRYLRESLLTAVDIQNISDSLNDIVPRNSQQLVNRVENTLSGNGDRHQTHLQVYKYIMEDLRNESMMTSKPRTE